MSSTANARRGAAARPALAAVEPPREGFGPALAADEPRREGFGPALAAAEPPREGFGPALAADEPRREGFGPALTADNPPRDGRAPARGRAPRPWAVALQRPAGKILLAGGLTLAGWLLSGALSGGTAAAAEHSSCPDAPAVSTVDRPAKPLLSGLHRASRRVAFTCSAQRDESTPDTKDTADTAAPENTAPESAAPESTVPDTTSPETTAPETTAPQVTTYKAATSKAKTGGGLLGGLVGGVLNTVGGTLNTVTNTVGGTLNTVTTTVNGTLDTVGSLTDTLSHTVLAPLTQPPADNPAAPALLPLDDVLGPVFSGGSNSGGVTATVPGLGSGTVIQAAPPAAETAATTASAPVVVTVAGQPARYPVIHLVERQNTLPAQQEQPRDFVVHARNGGGGDAPGLPSGTGALSAPASSASAGHDGPGGARHAFAVHTDDVTTTQLKLIGASRDHDVDGAGREAALPTASPD